MRKIKFRARDNSEKHFVYFDMFTGPNNHTPPIYNWAHLEPWEQFSGIYDKNGNEIYEGDIIKHDRFSDGKFIEIYQVVFRDGAFMLGDSLWMASMVNSEDAIIVGNIYENPELLIGKIK